MSAKYRFYEIVRVASADPRYPKLDGLEGAVLGIAEENG